MPAAWKPLNLHHKHSSIPPLLIKYEFGSENYRVWLTDLSYIWTESLDRRQFVRRALDMDTSIDPSEDAAQRRLFLKGIEDALQQSPGTSLSMDESNDIQQLTLHATTSLPHPLQPLEWTFRLVLAPQTTFASDFVSPLLSQQLTAKAEKTSLLQLLKEKDHVISKLVEKMQGDGVDLVKVFPGAATSKSGTTGPNARRAVAKSIKGLTEFDQDQWQSRLAKDNGPFRDWGDFLAKAFDDDGKDIGEGPQVSEFGEWWKRIRPKDSQREGTAPTILKTNAVQEDVVEDEFQRQLTPPKSVAQASKREPGLAMDTEPKVPSSSRDKDLDESDSTTDESDDDLQSSHSKPLSLRINGAVADGSANASTGIQSEPMDLDDDALTASQSSASDIDRAPAKTHLLPNSKPKLGKIGGKGKGSSPDALVAPTSKPKLGKIGGKRRLGKVGGIASVSSQNDGAASIKLHDPVSPTRETRDKSAAPHAMEPERSRTVQRHPEPSPPRETSQERANRKREQLKRELESKSQATTKKKRKF